MTQRGAVSVAVAAVLATVPVWVGLDVSRQAQATTAQFVRLDADDTYDMAIDIARQIADGNLATLTDLIIATGEHPTDAIVSAGLASYLDTCPRPDTRPCNRTATLLTRPDTLPQAVAEAIAASGVPASRITVLGGTAAITDETHRQIAVTAGWDGRGENPVVRVAGATRYATATAIATHLRDLATRPGATPLAASYRTIIVANGEHPADALAASTLAYRSRHLLLLASSNSASDALDTAIDTLDAHCALVIGGTSALPATLDSHLDDVLDTTGTGACGAERIAGTDRHDTATLIATQLADRHGAPTGVLLTNSQARPLPLTAAPLSRTGTALLSTRTERLPTTTLDWLDQHPTIARITAVGPETNVSPQAAARALDTTITTPAITPAATTATTTTTVPPPPSAFPNRAGGTLADLGYGVSTLSDGSAIVTGEFRNTATFGAFTTTSAGNRDVFVAKVNPDGTWAWATRAGGSSNDYANAVTALSDGSAIVTGHFWGTATFGPITTTSVGDFDVFVAKVDPNGNWVWATRAGGSSTDNANAVTALSDGSAIVTGEFQVTATFGTTTTTSAGNRDVFVAKVNVDGTWAWATRAGGTQSEVGRGVSALSDGSAIITGEFASTATFPGAVAGSSLTSAGLVDLYAAKVDANGNWVWATRAGGTQDDFGYGVSTLGGGAALVTGSFRSVATFGAATTTSYGQSDAFLAKLNADGTWAWATRAGGTQSEVGRGVSALPDESALITGEFQDAASFPGAPIGSTLAATGGTDIFVAKVNVDGTWAWASAAGGVGNETGNAIATMANGSAIITGTFDNIAQFGTSSITNAGGSDIFVARVTASGVFG